MGLIPADFDYFRPQGLERFANASRKLRPAGIDDGRRTATRWPIEYLSVLARIVCDG